MTRFERDFVAQIRECCAGEIASINPHDIAGLDVVAATALYPVYRPLIRLRSAAGLCARPDKLPPLLTELISEMSVGLTKTLDTIVRELEGRVEKIVRIQESDSDVHPGYRFSSVLADDCDKKIAVKFRLAETELFLKDLLLKSGLDPHFRVPQITSVGEGIILQEYVTEETPNILLDSGFWYSAGQFLRLCDIIGINDLHCHNAIFDGRSLCVIDGETILHSRRTSPLSQKDSPLSSHLLFPYGFEKEIEENVSLNYAIGALSDVLVRNMGFEGCDMARVAKTTTNQILEGYKSFDISLCDILESMPDYLVLRDVRFPTTVYASILEAASIQNYFGTTGSLEKTLLDRLNALYPNELVENVADASTLSRSQIPFREIRIEKADAIKKIASRAALIDFDIENRLNELRRAVQSLYQNLLSTRLHPPVV